MNSKYHYGTGRRKTSVARVFIKNGSGNIIINNMKLYDYFSRKTARMIVTQPMELNQEFNKFDFKINVYGGGETGQSGAIRLGIARALLQVSQEFKPVLRTNGFLTRDSRKVERKKVGCRKSRRKRQFSKR